MDLDPPVCDECGTKKRRYGRRWRCRVCAQKYQNNWRKHHSGYKEQHANAETARKKRAREQIIDAYGERCACCGESERSFLCIDHKRGGGGLHRIVRTTFGVWKDIIAEGFPADYQLLCANCNMAKERVDGCPHQRPNLAAGLVPTEVDTLTESERGTNGFGSSGV